jgi:hypothetical protein
VALYRFKAAKAGPSASVRSDAVHQLGTEGGLLLVQAAQDLGRNQQDVRRLAGDDPVAAGVLGGVDHLAQEVARGVRSAQRSVVSGQIGGADDASGQRALLHVVEVAGEMHNLATRRTQRKGLDRHVGETRAAEQGRQVTGCESVAHRGRRLEARQPPRGRRRPRRRAYHPTAATPCCP